MTLFHDPALPVALASLLLLAWGIWRAGRVRRVSRTEYDAIRARRKRWERR